MALCLAATRTTPGVLASSLCSCPGTQQPVVWTSETPLCKWCWKYFIRAILAVTSVLFYISSVLTWAWANKTVVAVLQPIRLLICCTHPRKRMRALKLGRAHTHTHMHAQTRAHTHIHRSFHISFLSSWIKSRAAKAPTPLPCHTNSFQIPSHIKFMRLQRSHLFNAIR